MLKGGVGQKQPSEERCTVIRSNSPPLNKKEKVLKGEGRCQALLDAESELVSIAGTVMSSLGRRQERRQTKESGSRRRGGVGQRWGGGGGDGVVAPQGSLTKKTCGDDPQMAAENCQWRCFREPQIWFSGRHDCVKSDRRREVDRIKRVKLQHSGAGAGKKHSAGTVLEGTGSGASSQD